MVKFDKNSFVCKNCRNIESCKILKNTECDSNNTEEELRNEMENDLKVFQNYLGGAKDSLKNLKKDELYYSDNKVWFEKVEESCNRIKVFSPVIENLKKALNDD